MKNVVAIVGKPNVGKSTLFNKLIKKRVAIVHDSPGVTRDRIYGKVQWSGKEFQIIDTGGIQIKNVPFQKEIQIQAQIAIEEATVILFVIDGREEISNDDYFVLKLLRKSGKKVIIVANKLESNVQFDYSLYSLGVENIFPISAIHSVGIGDLLDEVIQNLDFEEYDNNNDFKLAIIGRPNAGKSSLLNTLLNEQRAIVSEISGTTRDSVTGNLEINGRDYFLVDTAGINRKSKLVESVDHYALMRAMNSLEEADLSLIIIDATLELNHFDSRLAGYAFEMNKPIILVINKWDLVNKETNTMVEYEKKIRKNYKFLDWAQIIFISAKHNSRINKLKDAIDHTRNNLSKEIKPSLLNEVLVEMQIMQPAPSLKGRRLEIKFGKQVLAKVPTFLLFVNDKKHAHFSYLRYIENQIRKNFGFEGVPIKIILRNNNEINTKDQ